MGGGRLGRQIRHGAMRVAMAAAAMAILLAVLGGTSTADDGDVAARRAPVPRPAIGDEDPRIRVDADAPPWRGVGKIQATTGDLHTSCTGALVAPAVVLTAAHCVYNIRTRR
jgi:protease YdgD